MKHLKPYKIFESGKNWEVRDEINDLLSNLIDDYSIRVSYMGGDDGYVIVTSKEYGDKIRIDDIKGDVIRMIKFLKDRYRCVISYSMGPTSQMRDLPLEELEYSKTPGVVSKYITPSVVSMLQINLILI